MALGKIKVGHWGRYYEYYKDKKKKTLGLKDQGEHLEPEQIDELIENGKIDFDIDGEIFHAELEPYKNRRGEDTFIIKYHKGDIDSAPTSSDIAKIEELKDKILIELYRDNTEYWAVRKINNLLNTSGLSKTYYSGILNTELKDIKMLVIYHGDIKRDVSNISNRVVTTYVQKYYAHGRYLCKELTHSDYLAALDKERDMIKDAHERSVAYEKEKVTAIADGIRWMRDLESTIWPKSDETMLNEVLEALEPIVASVPTNSELNFTKAPVTKMGDLFEDIDKYVKEFVYDKTSLESMKANVLKILRHNYDYFGLREIRIGILKDVNTNGLDAVTSEVSLDTAFDLGTFKNVQRALIKSANPVEHICMHMYKEETKPEKLRQNIINMLKVYHDFTDFPNKDIKAIAKFVAVHNLKDYYDKVLEFDEAIEVIIDEAKPELRKKALMSVSGGRRDTTFLKDKSFYFEKVVRLKENIFVNDPLHLLSELRELIDEFNVSSDVAILVNIELHPDGHSFNYQFYTFADSASDDVNGSRLQYLTRLYNRGNPEDKRIYFDYE